MVGNLAGIASPLTDARPTSNGSKVAVVIVNAWALAIFASFIGVFISAGLTSSWVEFERRIVELGFVRAVASLTDTTVVKHEDVVHMRADFPIVPVAPTTPRTRV